MARAARRLSWKTVYGAGKEKEKDAVHPPSGTPLAPPQEGVELDSYASPSNSLSSSSVTLEQQHPLSLSRTTSRANSLSEPDSRPTTPNAPRGFRPLTKVQDASTSTNGLERVTSHAESTSGTGAFSRMMSTLTLSRSGSDDKEKERGRSARSDHDNRHRSSSTATTSRYDPDTHSLRSRSQSPFHLRRWRTRDRSPSVGAIMQSDVDSDTESIRPRGSAYISDDEDSNSDEEDSPESDHFDSVTEANTEQNALVVPSDLPDVDGEIADPLGEGQNVVVPLEPYFPTTLNHTNTRNPRRRKSTRHHEPLPLKTGRPAFQRDRCTITITQGDPITALKEKGRKSRSYIVASDISDESRYAVEWAIGTVLRDGDELLIVTIIENDSKIDPPVPNAADRAAKLRSQQERQGMAYILCRQATSLLQRTRLNTTVKCEAWHAKNARHMVLDIVDHVEPVMLIVGSRGLGQLKGIILGSTSHYLIQKCSVPVMVARRRLKRPPRKAAHLAKHRARVSLAEAAGVERVTQRVDEEVAHMRDEIEREEDRETARMRDAERVREGATEEGEEEEAELEGEGHAPSGH
ncbi:hypothetical protein K488DRAFT_54240 [Vararia minispora EC-137]|uniref:Uncharacterized protein n=1 Tax=Vararia minispora EC-137 TaxID=1314806 RepID=A0ACB8QFP6_9AGAM|nr:hypothetical protein K488DRAFT_54240 [Vararia minispora EC-137]